MKRIGLILCAMIVSVCLFIVGSMCINNIKTKQIHSQLMNRYEEAVSEANQENFETAQCLFNDLLIDCQSNQDELLVSDIQEWIKSIEETVDSPFIGEWRAKNSEGEWRLDISISVFNEVYLRYNKSFTTPNGTSVSDLGELALHDDGCTASYKNSAESNARHYKLVLKNQNTMDVYFDGDLEVTLTKKVN